MYFLYVQSLLIFDGLTFVPLFQEEMTLIVSRAAAVFHNLILPENIPGVLQYIPPRILEQIPFISLTPGHGTYELQGNNLKNFKYPPLFLWSWIIHLPCTV